MKKASLLAVLLVFMTMLAAFTVLPERAKATTLYVGGSGPGNYTAIQNAIDDATPGDTVFVFGGAYLEKILVNKTLSLVGENKETTIIDASGVGIVVNVSSDWVNITGFTVMNSGPNEMGIRLYAANNCSLTANTVTGNTYGIYLFASADNTITGNAMPLNKLNALYLVESDRNVIADNNASSNLFTGIVMYDSRNNTIANNSASRNLWGGLGLWYSSNNSIRHNAISSNKREGVYLEYSHGNIIALNSISLNGARGVDVSSSTDNKIYHNNMLDNIDVYDLGQAADDTTKNQWDNGYPSGGNYWSDYIGDDEKSGANQNQGGSDGLGDTPHDIVGAGASDRYPLMSRINRPPICAITEPTSGAVVSGATAIMGIAFDWDGTLDGVEIKIEEGAWTPVTGTTSWTYEWDTSTVSDGSHTIYARSFDGTNYSDEAEVGVVVNNASPPPSEEESILGQAWFWVLGALMIIAVILILALLVRKRMQGQ